MNGTPKEAKGTPAAPAKPRGRRPAPKEAAEAGRVWTGERVSVGEGHPEPPVPSSTPAAIVPGEAGKPGAAEGEAHWYVVHAYSGHEEKVRNNLMKRVDSMDMHDRIFEVLVPTEDVIEIKDGQRRHVAKRTFPGYILVNMMLSDESWYVVGNTPGVTSFVGSGNKPVPLERDEVRKILKQMEVEAPKARISYQRGQSVKVIDGPFAEFIGVVDDISLEKGKVWVLVSFFGRETRVELDFLQVEKL